MRQKRSATLTRVCRGSLPWAAHCVASTLKWWLVAIMVVGQGNAEVFVGGDVAGGGLFGPVQDGLDGALLETEASLAQAVTQGCHSSGAELLGRGKVAEQMPGYGTFPELVEAGG